MSRSVINSFSEKRTVLKITNVSKELMYSEIIPKPDYSRIFKFPKQDDGQINFQLTYRKETINKSFSIAAINEEIYEVKENN